MIEILEVCLQYFISKTLNGQSMWVMHRILVAMMMRCLPAINASNMLAQHNLSSILQLFLHMREFHTATALYTILTTCVTRPPQEKLRGQSSEYVPSRLKCASS